MSPRLLARIVSPAVIAVIIALVSARPASAATPTPASGAPWSPNERVEYRWKDGAEPPGWAKVAMNAAAADSNSSRKAKAAIFSHRDGASSWLAYTDDIPTNWAIGYTVGGDDWFSIRMRPHGTQLDWGTLRWCQFYDDPPYGCYDLEMVTLHEFGHAQSLGHVEEGQLDEHTDSIMLATGLHTKAKAGWNQHTFGRCDVARLQIRYEPLTASTAISTCLDLPTDLTLSASANSVDYGDNVTLTAKLKIGSNAPYASLASEPLSGRSVILQRRTPNANSWTTVGAMNAVTDETGRYVKTLAVTASYDYRVFFNGPGDEGLKGSTSSTVRVSSAWTCSGAKYASGSWVEIC